MTALPPSPVAAAPSRRWRPALLAGVALAVVAIALAAFLLGRGGGPDAEAVHSTPSAAASTALPAAVQVECANIDRARNAWIDSRAPKLTEDATAAREIDLKMGMEDSKAYLQAVQGYDDQPSKALASAIAQYNLELSILNAEVSVSGKGSEDTALSVAVAARKVSDAYTDWQNETCV